MGTSGALLKSDSVERRLAERQILVKDEKSKSWFLYVNKVFRQYGLPSTMDLLDVSYTKAHWRDMYVQAVDRYWTDKILAEVAEKSSLKCINTQKYSIGQVQLVWCDAGHDIMSIQKAGWKARLMTGT